MFAGSQSDFLACVYEIQDQDGKAAEKLAKRMTAIFDLALAEVMGSAEVGDFGELRAMGFPQLARVLTERLAL